MTIAELPTIWNMMIWGFVATVAMTIVMQGAQGLGLSRLSLPFLLGTFFTGDRRRAVIVGFVAYVIGGWLFAFLYFLLFSSLGVYTWWLGLSTGLLHGLFLLVAALPVLPYIHPRMASEYDGASAIKKLEPPGFMALNYGSRTPLTTLAARPSMAQCWEGFHSSRQLSDEVQHRVCMFGSSSGWRSPGDEAGPTSRNQARLCYLGTPSM